MVKDVNWRSTSLVGCIDNRLYTQGFMRLGSDPTPSLAEGPLGNLDSLFPQEDKEMSLDNPLAGQEWSSEEESNSDDSAVMSW